MGIWLFGLMVTVIAATLIAAIIRLAPRRSRGSWGAGGGFDRGLDATPPLPAVPPATPRPRYHAPSTHIF